MTLKTLAAASCLSMATATTAISAPITLDFTFDGVTGTFFGLDDADGTSAASSFDLSFAGSTFTGISTDFFAADYNEFRFFNGKLTWAGFRIGVDEPFHLWRIDILSTDGMTELDYIQMFNGYAGGLFYTACCSGVVGRPVGITTFEINPVTAVPLPAGGVLLLSAVGGVAALKRRKKRAA